MLNDYSVLTIYPSMYNNIIIGLASWLALYYYNWLSLVPRPFCVVYRVHINYVAGSKNLTLNNTVTAAL